MSLSLPVDPPSARSLTDVVPQSIAALRGGSAGVGSDWFPPARSALVLVIDGLGRTNLAARAGHARFLSSRMGKRDSVRTVFPSTTATALTGLLTGTPAGEHGIVGYRARVPGTDTVPNQLKGWETDALDPLTWQRSTPLLESEAAAGRPCFVVTKGMYRGTGFTRAIQRGAEFVPVDDLESRLLRAAELTTETDGALTYVYVPELDSLGHAHGWESDRWTAGLEQVDAAVATLERALGRDVGAVVTADHGMVDVPAHRQILVGEGDPLWEDVHLVGGEPRMLHLYARDGRGEAVRRRWSEAEAHRSWVLSREEAVSAGLFGPAVAPEVLQRIGDVLVAARSGIAYYDDREPDKRPQRMIGQHGSLTDDERIVPLIRLGAFAR